VENQIRIRIAARGGALRHSRSLRDGMERGLQYEHTILCTFPLFASLSLYLCSLRPLSIPRSHVKKSFRLSIIQLCARKSTTAVMPRPVNKAIILLGL
jgi:hypothetical protein